MMKTNTCSKDCARNAAADWCALYAASVFNLQNKSADRLAKEIRGFHVLEINDYRVGLPEHQHNHPGGGRNGRVTATV